MAEHTPTPWRAEKVSAFDEYEVLGPRGESVAAIYVSDGCDEPTVLPSQANAALIVRAVNSHDALVKALRAVVTANSACDSQATHEAIWAAHETLAALSALGEQDR